jgi:hypothetical protein
LTGRTLECAAERNAKCGTSFNESNRYVHTSLNV